VRRILAAVFVVLGVGGSAAAPAAPVRVASAGLAPAMPVLPVVVTYAPPVPAPLHVVRGFEPPSSPYGPGHRGVDLATRPGEVIRAPGAATVQFAGAVAGRGVVVLAHPDTVTTEYEPVRPSVHAGQALARGQPIGRIDGTHGSCAPDACLHWGAKRASAYFDPLSLLHPLGPVRLLPWTDPSARAGVPR